MSVVRTALQGVLLSAGLAFSSLALSQALPADMQGKVDKYKQKLVEWAATPAVVAAVKDANAKAAAPIPNAKWEELAENDAAVAAYTGNAVAKQLAKWEEDKGINKLFLRDAKGNLIAASNKPLLFNNATRPAFANAIKGSPWAAGEVKPDPTTQKKSVQLGVPVLDGGKPVGVLHTAVEAE